jgi:hypothetical protein
VQQKPKHGDGDHARQDEIKIDEARDQIRNVAADAGCESGAPEEISAGAITASNASSTFAETLIAAGRRYATSPNIAVSRRTSSASGSSASSGSRTCPAAMLACCASPAAAREATLE